VLRQLRPLAYVRYVDDFLLFAKDKDSLRSARRHLQDHLDGLRLRLHDGKSRTYRTADGVTFLGWRLFPDHRRLVRGNVVRFRRRLGKLKVQYELGELGWQEVTARVRAWDAHAAHGDTWKLREAVFGGVLFHSAARATRQARGT
jgi:RNA-directed DNA polymerase